MCVTDGKWKGPFLRRSHGRNIEGEEQPGRTEVEVLVQVGDEV